MTDTATPRTRADAPTHAVGTPPAVRVWEAHFTAYRTVWRSNLMGSIIQPLLYLLGMGLGVGALVDRGDDADQLLEGLTYFQFLAPALIATTAMMVTTNEAMWPVMGGFKWWRSFHAAAATPVSAGQVAAGTALWHLTKALLSAAGVATVLLFFADTRGWGVVVAIPFGALTGAAFAAPMMAWSATRENDRSFPVINRFVIMPLFLFAGAFYPVSQLPDGLETVAVITPLWHGVELCRDATYQRLELGPSIVHVSYLVSLTAAGWLLAARSFRKRLYP